MTMVLVITLLTLFAVKWDLLEEGAGEIQTSGAPFKRLLILHLMTLRVVVENGAHALTILKTIVVTAKIFSLSVMGQVCKII